MPPQGMLPVIICLCQRTKNSPATCTQIHLYLRAFSRIALANPLTVRLNYFVLKRLKSSSTTYLNVQCAITSRFIYFRSSLRFIFTRLEGETMGSEREDPSRTYRHCQRGKREQPVHHVRRLKITKTLT